MISILRSLSQPSTHCLPPRNALEENLTVVKLKLGIGIGIGNFELSIAKFDSSFCIIVCRTTRAYKFIIELNFYALIYDYHLPPSLSLSLSLLLKGKSSRKAAGERRKVVAGQGQGFSLGWAAHSTCNILC